MFSIFSHLQKLFGAKPPADEATDSIETKSIETTQTDTSYSKEVEQQQSMPASTWTIPLCGPLLNRLWSKNDTSNTTTNPKRSPSFRCADCIADAEKDTDEEDEKDDFVIIDNPVAVKKPARNLPLPPIAAPDETGRIQFNWDLPYTVDNVIDPRQVALIGNYLERLSDSVAGDAPINYSTRRMADMAKSFAANFANRVGKAVDEQLNLEAAKVERIRKKAEEAKKTEEAKKVVDGKEVDDKEVD
ncbi:hypothetical protein QBC45DRAFT_421123 [Copromyces sp. CBS 386.78]|nr:hypothetical protein QBC45DRAFT_421123 [Copromyces sp. CBS 386.78]